MVALALLGVAGGVVAVWRPAPEGPEPVAVKAIPHEWTSPPPGAAAMPPEREEREDLQIPRSPVPEMGEEAPAGHVEPAPVLLVPYSSRGQLAYSVRGGILGHESYTLTVGSEGIRLTSAGQFTVRLLFVPMRATFTQEAVLDAQGRPVSYVLEVRAPLGMSRTIVTEVEGERVTVISGDERGEASLAPGPALVLGMPSSLAVLPALVVGPLPAAIECQVLVVGTTPSSRTEEGAVPTMIRVEPGGERVILAGGSRIAVDTYRLPSAGDAVLLARGREFLGAQIGEGTDSLFVYRSDYFPDGFELVP
ncbi:MAG: hypothetical protein PHZ21_00375 [Candidatus Bipolaricaulis sp.]|nr:hypothetical protein [Candidatus Bipolaricaulis sp.]